MAKTTDLLPIGRFARSTGLTVRALRHYDLVGVLRPAHVDAATGYRYYALAQAREAEAIRRLRALDVPLEEIRGLLDCDEATRRERLAAHRSRLEGRLTATSRMLAELRSITDGKEPLVPDEEKFTIHFELDIRDVPEQTV